MDEKIYNFFQLNAAKGFKIVHLNIRSLLKKIDQLRVILEGSTVDIFTLSETWLNDKIDSQLLHIQGYNVLRQDRGASNLVKKRGGGLITYVKSSMDVYVQEAENMVTKDLEVQWLRIARKNAKNLVIANVYRPPTGNVKQALKKLGDSINSLKKYNEELIILGDFNVDYKNKKSPNYKALKFFERAHSLDQNISTTTRNTKKSSSLLDIAFTNMKYIKTAGTLDSFLSDHQPIFIIKKKGKNTEKIEQQFEGRSYRHYDKQQFLDNIEDRDWSQFFNAEDPGHAWDIMQNILVEEAERICPVRQFKIRNTRPCWITNEMIEQMKDRDYFYRKAKTTNSEDDWNIAKFHRNQANSSVRNAKADFIKDQLRNNEGNSAKFWRNIKQIMPTKKGHKTNTKILLHDNNNMAIQNLNIAEYMNNFFANLGNVNRAPIDIEEEEEMSQNPDLDHLDNDFTLDLVTKFEIDALTRKINISKSSGIELLSSRLLKDSFHIMGDKLAFLYNLSIQTTIFPDKWKKALVIPIPKSGDLKKVENYRPISLLPLPGKILEKLIHTQLSFHLEENEILSNNQFGFRKQRNTCHAISQLLNQIYTNINKATVTAAIYIDFSKAFNCVQHKTLLNKLKHLNLDRKLIAWIGSYLNNREQRTMANNTYSTYRQVNQGVPQGSVLGPLLYIIYANDIAERIKYSGFTFYADDMVLYSKKKSVMQSGLDLQRDLDSITNWCVDNEIYINIDKTKVMFFGSKAKINSIDLPQFQIDGTTIQRTQTYTYLGIKLDEQLTLETHANELIRKVSAKIYQLTKIRAFLTSKAAVLIYKNMILPILEYADIFLHSASQKIRKKLQTLQNKALRCALHKNKYAGSADIHKEARILKLKDRRNVHVLLHMFQLAQMPDFKLWKTHQSTGVRTRSSKKKLITICKPNNEKYKKSITYQGPKLWNSLPGHLQKLDSYRDFKIQVNKLFEIQTKEKTNNLDKAKTKSKSKPRSKTKQKQKQNRRLGKQKRMEERNPNKIRIP